MRRIYAALLVVAVASEAPAQGAKGQAEDPLPAGALARFGSPHLRHDGPVTALAWSHDGAWLASASHDKTVCLWDAKSGRRLRRFLGHTGAVFALAVSSDGKRLASAGRDQTVRLWDVATGKQLWQVVAHDGAVHCVAFSPDDQLLASGGADAAVRLWDAGTGKQNREMTVRADKTWNATYQATVSLAVHGVAFSPDGQTLASGGDNKAVRLWEVKTGKKLRELVTQEPAAVNGVSFAPDGKILAAAALAYANTQLWDVAAGKMLPQLPEAGLESTNVAFSRDGKTLVTCPKFGAKFVRLSDAATGHLQRLVPVSGGSHFAVALSPDRQTLACGGDGPQIRLIDLATDKDCIPTVARAAELWQITKSFEPKLPDGVRRDEVWRSAFSCQKRFFAYVDARNLFHLWDLQKGQETQQFPVAKPIWEVAEVALSPDASTVAIAIYQYSRFPTVYLWDCATGKQTVECSFGKFRGGLTFSPDGRSLAGRIEVIRREELGLIRQVDAVRICETATGDGRADFDDTGVAAFSPDGRLLATARGYNRLVEYFMSEGGTMWSEIIRPEHRYADDPWKAETIAVWDLATGQKIAGFKGHVKWVTAMAFFDGGKKLASIGWEGLGYAWTLPPRAKQERVELWPDTGMNIFGRAIQSLDDVWARFAGDADSAHAYAAQRKLAVSGKAVEFLKKHLRPVPHADPAAVEAYRAALTSDKYAVREKGTAELKKLGSDAEPILRKLLEGNPPLEQRLRVEKLLQLLEGSPGRLERLRQDRALEVLERLGDADACALLKSLADGAAGMWLTRQARASLERLGK
jgi:WD40 repeat protein